MDRYTSPETSRDLAAAGLERAKGVFWNYHQDVMASPNLSGARTCECSPRTAFCIPSVRALDLTDILREIRLLVSGYELGRHGGFSRMVVYVTDSDVLSFTRDGASDVDVAAEALLALLRERRKP